VTLESAGNVLRARVTGWLEHRMFKGQDTDINRHAFRIGAAEIDRVLLFRDWLRDIDAADQARPAKRTWRRAQYDADARTTIADRSPGHWARTSTKQHAAEPAEHPGVVADRVRCRSPVSGAHNMQDHV